MINMGVNSKTVVPMEPKQKTANEIIKEIGEQILEKVEETQTEKEEKEQEEAAAVLELSEHTIEQMKSQLESMESEKEGWVNLGKMMEMIAKGMDANEALAKASGQYGRVDDAAKLLDPRHE